MSRPPLSGLHLLERRSFLSNLGASIGSVGLLHLLAGDGLLAAEAGQPFRPRIDPTRPYAKRPPQFPARAEQLLIIFCAGAVSHVDTWDEWHCLLATLYLRRETGARRGVTPGTGPRRTWRD